MLGQGGGRRRRGSGLRRRGVHGVPVGISDMRARGYVGLTSEPGIPAIGSPMLAGV